MGRILSPTKNTADRDVVMTPTELATNIIDHYRPTGNVLDPCRGAGAFFNSYPTDVIKHWCEINDGQDFAKFTTKIDWIITNPPWSEIPFFLEKGMSLANNIVYLAPITNFVTRRRLRLIRDNDFGIKEIYGVETPKKPWPQSGFQLAAVHFQKAYKGPIFLTGILG